MINNRLTELKLPPLTEKEKMLDILLREEYGYLPQKPENISFDVTPRYVRNFCAGKATLSRVVANCIVEGREFSFPFYVTMPTGDGKYPFFVHINFRDNVPDMYMPTEELVDNGFAVLSFCYKDVTSDSGDFSDGLAGVLFPEGKRTDTDCGKIAMWAWAAHRVMDYAETLENLDMTRSVVCGHSRLGKTALLTAATDERFAFAYSNNSGCSGAAITRGKLGETVKDICNRFPYWFCENYKKYADDESNMPFDQHYLIATIAPRYVCVGSASADEWAGPESEQLACVAASPAFEALGKKGFIAPDRVAEVGESFFEGDIGYHLREGLHYFGRADWNQLIRFIRKYDR